MSAGEINVVIGEPISNPYPTSLNIGNAPFNIEENVHISAVPVSLFGLSTKSHAPVNPEVATSVKVATFCKSAADFPVAPHNVLKEVVSLL